MNMEEKETLMKLWRKIKDSYENPNSDYIPEKEHSFKLDSFEKGAVFKLIEERFNGQQ